MNNIEISAVVIIYLVVIASRFYNANRDER